MKDAATPHRLYLWPRRLLAVTRGVSNRPHAHLAASLLLALEQPFELRVAKLKPCRVRAALVAPDVEQALDSRGAPALILHLDPDDPAFGAFKSVLAGEAWTELDAARFKDLLKPARALLEDAGCEAAQRLVSDLLARIGEGPSAAPDPRAAAIAAQLRRELPERLDAKALAAGAGLSESRLMHLFKQEFGVSMRRFLLGVRLERAMLAWAQGTRLTDLAHEVGFYDQPHLVHAARASVDFLPSAFADADTVRIQRCAVD